MCFLEDSGAASQPSSGGESAFAGYKKKEKKPTRSRSDLRPRRSSTELSSPPPLPLAAAERLHAEVDDARRVQPEPADAAGRGAVVGAHALRQELGGRCTCGVPQRDP